jgi:hypothetical protein
MIFIRYRFKVVPSIKAATMSPLAGLGPCSKITISPSRLPAPTIESPRTSRPKRSARGESRSKAESKAMDRPASWIVISATPVGIEPKTGMSIVRSSAAGSKTRTTGFRPSFSVLVDIARERVESMMDVVRLRFEAHQCFRAARDASPDTAARLTALGHTFTALADEAEGRARLAPSATLSVLNGP